MKYIVKTEIYNDDLPFNKWFCFNSGRMFHVNELIEELGIEKSRIGIVMVNEYAKSTNCLLKDRDRIRFIGRIYPEYL